MQRSWIVRCAVMLLILGWAVPPVVLAERGGNAGQSRTVESTIRDVNTTWQTVSLTDGTVLSTNDAKLLEQLRPGMRIRAAFEERPGRQNFINRLEVVQ